MGLCVFVIIRGVKGGIEKWSKIMMTPNGEKSIKIILLNLPLV